MSLTLTLRGLIVMSLSLLQLGTPAKPHALMNLLVFGQMLTSEEPICAGMTEKSMPLAFKDFTSLIQQN